jgi:hypothetical protein
MKAEHIDILAFEALKYYVNRTMQARLISWENVMIIP